MSVELYWQFLAALEKTPFDGQFMPYEWGNLPTTSDVTWWPYSDMFNEFSREIANSLNDLTNYTHRLKAWSRVISSMGDEEKQNAAHEFIDPLATVALNLPYVIRSRFIFPAAHLCHQANQSRATMPWKDNLPLDSEILFKEADNYGAPWQQYRPLKLCLERLGDKAYQTDTHDFRNSYNHRFSPRVVIGITQLVIRKVDEQTKQVSYVLGGTPALPLDVVAQLLSYQCKHGYAAFEAFQRLIREHEGSILAHVTTPGQAGPAPARRGPRP